MDWAPVDWDQAVVSRSSRFEFDLHGRMVAGGRPPSAINMAVGHYGAELQVIKAQPASTAIGVPDVIPERVDRLAGVSARSASVQPWSSS